MRRCVVRIYVYGALKMLHRFTDIALAGQKRTQIIESNDVVWVDRKSVLKSPHCFLSFSLFGKNNAKGGRHSWAVWIQGRRHAKVFFRFIDLATHKEQLT